MADVDRRLHAGMPVDEDRQNAPFDGEAAELLAEVAGIAGRLMRRDGVDGRADDWSS